MTEKNIQKDRKTMPNNYEIFNYWKDKKLPNGGYILHDYREPCCWACGYMVVVEEDHLSTKDIWLRTSGVLERCHIIPKMLGGSNEADNLFLMCKKCHIDSPDTSDKDYFFNWVIYRRENRTLFDALVNLNQYDIMKYIDNINILLRTFNISIEDFNNYIDIILKDEHLIKKIGNEYGYHAKSDNTKNYFYGLMKHIKKEIIKDKIDKDVDILKKIKLD